MSRYVVAAGVAAAVLAGGQAQPPVVTPTYTALPDLKAPLVPTDVGQGKTVPWPDFAVLHARLVAAADRPLPPDATPAAKVRSFRLKAGVDYLRGMHVRRLARGQLGPQQYPEVTRTADDVYRAALADEPDAAGRRATREEWVRVLKELERQVEALVPNILPPAELDLVRFFRLRAEGELLAAAGGKSP